MQSFLALHSPPNLRSHRWIKCYPFFLHPSGVGIIRFSLSSSSLSLPPARPSSRSAGAVQPPNHRTDAALDQLVLSFCPHITGPAAQAVDTMLLLFTIHWPLQDTMLSLFTMPWPHQAQCCRCLPYLGHLKTQCCRHLQYIGHFKTQ